MPKREDIQKILVIGSGPIVIGQACEFDYSGTQALQALREEGYQIILANSNPATIMTDPEFSDAVYIEPLHPEYLEKIIQKERPDAILPTMGGQTALNLAMALGEKGILEKYNLELLGANLEVIDKAENREKFKKTMSEIGVQSARSAIARSMEEGKSALKKIGLPVILRPSFTLGGEGGGTANTEEEYYELLEHALRLAPTQEVLIEESLIGWKEYELEVVRDKKDNVIIVCSIENVDAMGVHTGDSITVAPAQTLTDREYQELRNQAIRIIRAIGVETGGSNIQFAVNPKDGRIIVIEMNPRVSRSSALASKATGFPIARVASKLAVGYTLDELTNDITTTTPSSFEPSIDYVVTKIPRFDFEKFKPSKPILGTQMRSVGEVMAIGQTFEESFGKALAGLETEARWLKPLECLPGEKPPRVRWDMIDRPHALRIRAIGDALRLKTPIEELSQRSGIDPWFLDRLAYFLEGEEVLLSEEWPLPNDLLRTIKKAGWTDLAISEVLGKTEQEIRQTRELMGIHAAFRAVDTCAGEFEAKTPYLYSSYSGTDESQPQPRNKVLVLGGGPNRIGQGIEFDYCCVHAAMAMREQGLETIMINSNPETVSTDFNVSDKLYFEPLTPEHVLNIARVEKPLGVVVQFGGQTPLKIAKALESGGMKIIGTSTDSIDLAENRQRSEKLFQELHSLGLEQPPATSATGHEETLTRACELGFPVLVRPSYVLGGRGMKVVHSKKMLSDWLKGIREDDIEISSNRPILIDQFLRSATEVDVDAVCDGRETWVAGLMEHIEEAGIHSGDSACSLPPATLTTGTCERIRTYTREVAKHLNVIGLINIQFAVQEDRIFVLEVNPRASRTIPFVSKATGHPLAKIATQVMMGKTLHDLGIRDDFDRDLKTYNVKAPVFPFQRFQGVDVLLGPEMKSTGEVMGRAETFESAYSKAILASGIRLPESGKVFLSVRDEDKAEALPIAKGLKELGYDLLATSGTAAFFNRYDLGTRVVLKVGEGSPHCVNAIENGEYSMVINTTSEESDIKASFSLRRATLEKNVPYSTVLASARAMVMALKERKTNRTEPNVSSL